jgi:hypothetical protein
MITYNIPIEQLEDIELSNCKQVDEEKQVYCMPARYEVCGRCGGTGVVDCFPGGVPEEFFHEDPDFADDYYGGMYDKSCTECDGLRVVPDPDPRTELDKQVLEAHYEWQRGMADIEEMHAAERRFGC